MTMSDDHESRTDPHGSQEASGSAASELPSWNGAHTLRLGAQPLAAALGPELRVAVVDGPDLGKIAVIGASALEVGTGSEAGLQLADPSVSRQHVTIERIVDASGQPCVRVRDRGSRNGTFVGGQRVTEADATVGSVLRVGRTTLAVLMDGMPPTVEPSPPALGAMVGSGAKMHRLFNLLGRLAASDATILVRGETGSGKELVARTLHEQSRRAAGPFVVFDCAAVPESLIAGELFGHVRGAFTGATRDHVGAFERAHGGTLFIDEIGELSLDLQPKLLRALETRTVRRIGDREEQQIDVRIVAATHRDLPQMVAERRFREDLLYRLAVVTVAVPPLRERLEDLEALVARFAEKLDPPPPALPADVLAALHRHQWPGNLRELRNLVERAAALGSWREEALAPLVEVQAAAQSSGAPYSSAAQGASAIAAMGPAATGGTPASVPAVAAAGQGGANFREAKEVAMSAFERDYLAQLLAAHGGNVSAAARAADMDRSHLSSLVRKHGIK